MLGGPEVLTSNCGEVPGLLVTETCTVALEAGVSDTADGETWMVKGAACLTVSEKVSAWVMVPLLPVTVTVEGPRGAFCAAASWNAVDWKNPVTLMENGPDGKIVTPAGRPETVKLMVPVNPLTGFA